MASRPKAWGGVKILEKAFFLTVAVPTRIRAQVLKGGYLKHAKH